MKKRNIKAKLFYDEFFHLKYWGLNKGITISDVIPNCINICVHLKFSLLSPGVDAHNFQPISYLIHKNVLPLLGSKIPVQIEDKLISRREIQPGNEII